MGVAVERDGDRVPEQRLLETAGSEEREDLGRLAFDGVADGRVVQDGDATGVRSRARADSSLSASSTALVHESLDDLLAPGLERALAEAAAHALDAGEADAGDLARVPPSSTCHTGVVEDALDLVGRSDS